MYNYMVIFRGSRKSVVVQCTRTLHFYGIFKNSDFFPVNLLFNSFKPAPGSVLKIVSHLPPPPHQDLLLYL